EWAVLNNPENQFAVAGLAASGQTIIDDTDAVLTSYPEFFETLRFLSV
ncbi:MAG TPA: hypothetical protein PKL48_15215, partial [Thermodesulfobacteriota bacterium]|nr:hypothetical protein [Thermodesulfobacteriota bacterium]